MAASISSAGMKGEVFVGVRPEAWRIVSAEEGGLPVEVTVVEELGSDAFIYGTSDVEGTPANIIVRISAAALSASDTVRLAPLIAM